MPLPTNVTPEDVEAFRNACVLLRSAYTHYQTLYEAGATRLALLAEIAEIFFGDLNALLVNALIGGTCQITDPENTGGNENLTIEFLVNHSDFSSDPATNLRVAELARDIHVFRNKVLPARHKRIAHLDRSAALSDVNLGAASMQEWNDFWRNLDEFVAIFYARYIDPARHFHLNNIGMTSGADSLVKAMRESTYFNILLQDSQLTHRCTDVAFESKFSKA